MYGCFKMLPNVSRHQCCCLLFQSNWSNKMGYVTTCACNVVFITIVVLPEDIYFSNVATEKHLMWIYISVFKALAEGSIFYLRIISVQTLFIALVGILCPCKGFIPLNVFMVHVNVYVMSLHKSVNVFMVLDIIVGCIVYQVSWQMLVDAISLLPLL